MAEAGDVWDDIREMVASGNFDNARSLTPIIFKRRQYARRLGGTHQEGE
jgi:hypothetical protein